MKDKPSFPPRMAGWEYKYNQAEKYLKLLRQCNNIMPTCPICKGNLKTWERLAYNESKIIGHADDCKLAKALDNE